jgi:CheY-like chemotaxis protein
MRFGFGKILSFSRLRSVRSIVAENHSNVRILAVVPEEMQGGIRRQLSEFGMSPVFVSRATELGQYVRSGEVYQIALLPAAFPEMDWWNVWGELALLNPKPAILVYAHSASFQLWSGVLEAGGYDVIVEPFTDEKLKEAVLRAAKSFEQRALNNIGDGAGDGVEDRPEQQ